MRLIQTYKADMLNGVGLRNVYFFSGCTHNCKGCFNPETHDPYMSRSILWTEADYQQLLRDAAPDYIDGITLSGGDPLSPWNVQDIIKLCNRFSWDMPDKTIWLYTGYTYEEICHSLVKQEILNAIDVLCEGPYIDSLKSPEKPWVGSSNQRVIDVPKTLKLGKIVLFA